MKSAMDVMLDAVEWFAIPNDTLVEDGVLVTTHWGILHIGDFATIRCYQLNNGIRVIDAEDVAKMFTGRESYDSH